MKGHYLYFLSLDAFEMSLSPILCYIETRNEFCNLVDQHLQILRFLAGVAAKLSARPGPFRILRCTAKSD